MRRICIIRESIERSEEEKSWTFIRRQFCTARPSLSGKIDEVISCAGERFVSKIGHFRFQGVVLRIGS